MTKNNDISYQIPHKYPVALESVAISGTVRDFIAELVFELSFRNREDKNVEILYCFPLPTRAVVTAFSAADAAGKVTGTHDHHNDYDLIMEDNGAACKLELKEKNLLELALGNVPPDSVMKVTVKMLMPLELSERSAVFRLPFALAPRYVPQTYNWTENPVPSPLWDEAVSYAFSLNLEVDMTGLLGMHSPTHSIVSKTQNNISQVSLGFPGSIPDRDLILELRLRQSVTPYCLSGSLGKNGPACGRFIFNAEFDLPSPAEKNPEIIFMLDCSASMTSRRFEQALEALELALRALAPGDYFNVVTFGGDCRVLSPTPLPYNRKNLNAALEMLGGAHPNLAGTELLQILKVVAKLPRPGKSRRNILLISDGEVYNAHELLHYVRGKKINAAIFPLMVGSSSGQTILPQLGEASGGYCEMLDEESSISEMVLRQLSRIIQQPVRNVTLRAVNAEIEAPAMIPAIFDGDVYSLFFKINKLGEKPQVILEGKIRSRRIEFKAPIGQGSGAQLPVLWAAAQVGALEDSDTTARNMAAGLAAKFKMLTQSSPLMTVHGAAPADLANYYPAFRMVPLVLGSEHRRHFGNRQELMAGVHEEAAQYGENFLLKLLAAQQADGTFAAWNLLADRLGVTRDQLYRRVNRILRQVFGSARSRRQRELLLALLALKELPRSRVTAPARRKVMAVVNALPERAKLLKAAEYK